MTDNERKEKIDSVQSKMEPLNLQRIFIETNLYFVKERYTKDFKEEDKQEINDLNNQISELYGQINPLFSELRTLQCKYVIEYKGELTNPETQRKYWKSENEVFYLKNCCVIDTFSNGWDTYLQESCVNDLIKEIIELIYRLRYTNFQILNIKKL